MDLKKILILFLLATSSILTAQPEGYQRKYMGVWISTVKMLDYPSQRGLSSKQLKKEYIDMLDFLDSTGINVIFFQVRPAADAFFPSQYEPWSEWLTGKQGRAPEPYFDPLKFMITEAHKRGIQFHAWINPFRAIATIEYADISPDHITHRKPKWFFTYGLHKYFDPGIPEVRDYVTSIITDIVRRYDVDGIHFDDYFYPYPERDQNHKIIPIPDRKTYKKYGKKEFKNVADWRRNNINLFIKEVHDSIKAVDPDIIFGVSPPAVWRNKSRDTSGSATRGLAAYDWLYADILKWDTCGWVDYIAPQLYYPIGHKYADYKTLIKWWSNHIKKSTLFIGLNIQQFYTAREQHKKISTKQITDEIKLTEQYNNIEGFFFYRVKSLMQNPYGITDTLCHNILCKNYLYPPIASVDTVAPGRPDNFRTYKYDNDIVLIWDPPSDSLKKDSIVFYGVYLNASDTTATAHDFIFFTQESVIRIKRNYKPGLKTKKYKICISAFDKFHNESKKSCIEIKVNKKDTVDIAGMHYYP